MEHKTNLETNKHYKFDWCIIEGDNTVVCYNSDKTHDVHWLTDKAALFNVEIYIIYVEKQMFYVGKNSCKSFINGAFGT